MSQKMDHQLMAVTLSYINHFQNSFLAGKIVQFLINPYTVILPVSVTP